MSTDFEILSNEEILGDLFVPEQPIDEETVSTFQSSEQNQEIISDVYQPDIPYARGSDELADRQQVRTFMGGLTFQFWDEMEGFVVSLLNDDVSYEQARDEVRKKMAVYASQNPGAAITLELAGAVAPTLLSVFGGPVAMANSLKNIFTIGRSIFKTGAKGSTKSIAKQANIAGTYTGAYMVGSSEDPFTPLDTLKDFGTGYLFGAPIGGIGGIASAYGSSLTAWLSQFAKMNKVDKAVRAELQKLVQASGKTEEEIILAVSKGEIISENATLNNLIKQMASGKGKAQTALEEVARTRPGETRKELLDAMQVALGRGKSDKSLIESYTLSQKAIWKQEKKLYDNVFKAKGGNPEVSKEMAQQLDDAVKSMPELFEHLNMVYRTRQGNLLPLFGKRANGEIRMIRQPTLQDAEIMRRALDQATRKAYRDGVGDLGENLGMMEDDLRKLIDNYGKFGGELKVVREVASQVRRAREGYDYGTGILTGKWDNKPEVIQEWIKKHGDTPGVMDSLRIGLTQALKNQDKYTKIKEMAKSDSNLFQIVKMIMPKDKLDDIIQKAGVAAQAATSSTAIPGAAGSQTFDKFMAHKAVTRDAEGTAKLSAPGLISAIHKFFTTSGLSPKQAEKYVDIVTSQNADLVKKALVDDNAMGVLARIIDSLIKGTSQTVGQTVAKVGGTEVGEFYDPIGTSGTEGLLGLAGRNIKKRFQGAFE